MITAIIGAIGSILGTPDVISKGMDLIDDMHTSDEEDRASKTKAKTELMKAYAPFKVAQRWLALMFGVNFIVSFWVAVGLWAYGKDMDGFIAIMGVFNIGYIMMAIIMFYFGGGMIESVGNAKKK